MVPKGRARVEVRLDDHRVVRASPSPRVDDHGERSPHPYHRLPAHECGACGRGSRLSMGHPPSRICMARTSVDWLGLSLHGGRRVAALRRRAARSQRRQGQDRHRGTPGGPQQHQESSVCGLAGFGGAARPPARPPPPIVGWFSTVSRQLSPLQAVSPIPLPGTTLLSFRLWKWGGWFRIKLVGNCYRNRFFDVPKNGGILLANPRMSLYCTVIRLLLDSTKIHSKTCMAGV